MSLDTEHRELREEYRTWLRDFLPADYHGPRYSQYRWDAGLRRAHQQAAFDAGWLQPTWPAQHGGRCLGPAEAMAVRIEAAVGAAPKLLNIAGVNVAAPGIRDFGSPEQVEQLLVPCLRGDEWWALGMSEPEAGSDFAGLRTRAELRGDVYVVNGQKTWTTLAHEARWALLYARTDSGVARHKALSCLLLDLRAPGVTVRPIPMASVSDETFCEVFLDDVEVPATSLLGRPGDGWKIAMSGLEHERDMIWVMNWVEILRGLDRVQARADTLDGDLLTQLGRRLADAEALRATGHRVLVGRTAGRATPESSTQKLLGSEALQRTWELVAAAEGAGACTDPDLLFERQDALAATLYGGTSEVQRNIIGERVLGLPKA